MPFGAFKVALLGSGAAGKTYWAAMLQSTQSGEKQESTFRGMDVDSNDNVYVAFVDNSGLEARIAKFEQSDGLPTLAASTVLNNGVPTGNLTVWNDSGYDVITTSGSKNDESEIFLNCILNIKCLTNKVLDQEIHG